MNTETTGACASDPAPTTDPLAAADKAAGAATRAASQQIRRLFLAMGGAALLAIAAAAAITHLLDLDFLLEEALGFLVWATLLFGCSAAFSRAPVRARLPRRHQVGLPALIGAIVGVTIAAGPAAWPAYVAGAAAVVAISLWSATRLGR